MINILEMPKHFFVLMVIIFFDSRIVGYETFESNYNAAMQLLKIMKTVKDSGIIRNEDRSKIIKQPFNWMVIHESLVVALIQGERNSSNSSMLVTAAHSFMPYIQTEIENSCFGNRVLHIKMLYDRTYEINNPIKIAITIPWFLDYIVTKEKSILTMVDAKSATIEKLHLCALRESKIYYNLGTTINNLKIETYATSSITCDWQPGSAVHNCLHTKMHSSNIKFEGSVNCSKVKKYYKL